MLSVLGSFLKRFKVFNTLLRLPLLYQTLKVSLCILFSFKPSISLKHSCSLLISFSLIFSPPLSFSAQIPHSSVASSPPPSPNASSLASPKAPSSASSSSTPIPSHPTSSVSPLPLIPDASSSSAPSLDIAPNGVDIVNIANPDAQGISNNFFLEFNVKEQGIIFNNSLEAMTPTQLGGLITGNPNLDLQASLILNQVTSTSPSFLLGLMEVAGKEASLLIANPNGITCKDCGFINTKEAILTTGVIESFSSLKSHSLVSPSSPSFSSLDPSLVSELHLRVQKGRINIDSLDALKSQSLSLLSHSLKINGDLYAKELKILLGSNQISLDQKGALLLWQPIQE